MGSDFFGIDDSLTLWPSKWPSAREVLKFHACLAYIFDIAFRPFAIFDGRYCSRAVRCARGPQVTLRLLLVFGGAIA